MARILIVHEREDRRRQLFECVSRVLPQQVEPIADCPHEGDDDWKELFADTELLILHRSNASVDAFYKKVCHDFPELPIIHVTDGSRETFEEFPQWRSDYDCKLFMNQHFDSKLSRLLQCRDRNSSFRETFDTAFEACLEDVEIILRELQAADIRIQGYRKRACDVTDAAELLAIRRELFPEPSMKARFAHTCSAVSLTHANAETELKRRSKTLYSYDEFAELKSLLFLENTRRWHRYGRQATIEVDDSLLAVRYFANCVRGNIQCSLTDDQWMELSQRTHIGMTRLIGFLGRCLHEAEEPRDKDWYLQQRQHISHDDFHNCFLVPLGSTSCNPQVSRSILVENVWPTCKTREDFLRTDCIHKKVGRGIEAWGEIRKRIEIVLIDGPQECELAATTRFEVEATESRKWLREIDEFVEDFYSIAQSSVEIQEARVDAFWTAAEALRSFISAIGTEFESYFTTETACSVC